MIAATNSWVNLAGAQNRTNQAMGSEKKLDGEKVEVHMQPIQDSGQVSQGDSDSFRANTSGCQVAVHASQFRREAYKAKDALLPCAARKLAKCRLGTDSCI